MSAPETTSKTQDSLTILDPQNPSCSEATRDPFFEYVRRVQQADGSWACPASYTDTGCGWDDGPERGELQCKRQYVSKCTESAADPSFEYTRRIQQGDQWVCPAGYTDTGCQWRDGETRGELQCKRQYVSTCTETAANPSFEYTRRVQQGDQWVCPAGYTDTGCQWKDGQDLGELQCKRQYVSTCTESVADPLYEYTRRVQQGDQWVCPAGYTDTGCQWKDGQDLGELQCKRLAPEPQPVLQTLQPLQSDVQQPEPQSAQKPWDSLISW